MDFFSTQLNATTLHPWHNYTVVYCFTVVTFMNSMRLNSRYYRDTHELNATQPEHSITMEFFLTQLNTTTLYASTQRNHFTRVTSVTYTTWRNTTRTFNCHEVFPDSTQHNHFTCVTSSMTYTTRRNTTRTFNYHGVFPDSTQRNHFTRVTCVT